jgi:LytS/YehU family sensor histidine kinase
MAIMHGIEHYRRAAQLRARLSEVELEALRAPLHPHFLFNTLNGIAALLHRDPDAADDALVGLAELLRSVTHRRASEEIPLREEMALLDRYLAIIQLRFGDRLTVETAVPVDLGDAMVPYFVLQPLVENALEHGIGRQAGPGRVTIEACADGGSLRLSVSDTGPGPRASGAGGIGLSASRRRLAELYGAAQRLVLEPGASGGTRVSLHIPLRRQRALAGT